MKNLLMPKNAGHEEIEVLVDKLHHYGYLKPADWKTIWDYFQSLKNTLDDEEFIMSETPNPERIQKAFDEVREEYEWLYYLGLASKRLPLLRMNELVRHMFWNKPSNTIWDFKELVEMVNCWFEIEKPYKTSYKIAYGWQFAQEKDNFKPYLFGCVRNYLKRNGVEYETVELQKICALKDVDEGDA